MSPRRGLTPDFPQPRGALADYLAWGLAHAVLAVKARHFGVNVSGPATFGLWTVFLQRTRDNYDVDYEVWDFQSEVFDNWVDAASGYIIAAGMPRHDPCDEVIIQLVARSGDRNGRIIAHTAVPCVPVEHSIQVS